MDLYDISNVQYQLEFAELQNETVRNLFNIKEAMMSSCKKSQS